MRLSPNIILALGGTALWALSGKTKITDYRGSHHVGYGHEVCSYLSSRASCYIVLRVEKSRVIGIDK